MFNEKRSVREIKRPIDARVGAFRAKIVRLHAPVAKVF
jgi:hypothetical protein